MAANDWLRDLRFGARVLRRNPSFSLGALWILALGLGACGVIASVAQVVWFSPLTFPDSEQIVLVSSRNLERGGRFSSLAPADFRDLGAEGLLASVAAYRRAAPILEGELPQKLRAARVSEDFFHTLGVPAAAGRTLAAGDDYLGGRKIAVLGHRFWQSRFGAEATALGETLRLDGEPVTVVGIMPPGFDFPPQTDLWIPLDLSPEEWADRENRYIAGIGRLLPERSLERSQEEVSAFAAGLASRHSENQGFDIALRSLHRAATASMEPLVRILFAAGGLLLLVACGNLATLFSLQAASRLREMGIRSALGAGRRRLAVQVLIESLLLTALGGGLGLLTAWLGNRLLVRHTPVLALRWQEIAIDAEVLAALIGLTMFCGVLASLAPISRLWRSHRVLGVSAARGDRDSQGWRRNRLAHGLTVLQVVLSFVLLVNAGLLFRSFQNLLQVDPGFEPRGVLTLTVELPGAYYPEAHQRLAFYSQAIERLESLPGVETAGAISSLPLAGSNNLMRYAVPGREVEDDDYAPFVALTPGTLETLGIPLRAGRSFRTEDRSAAIPAMILNESLARRLFPDSDPVGQEIRAGGVDGVPHRVLGVIGDLRSSSLEEPGSAAMYGLYDQSPSDRATFCVRTGSDPESLARSAREVIRDLDPRLATDTPTTLDAIVRDSQSSRRLLLVIVTLFAGVALAMATVGIFGVLAFRLSRSLAEIGLRMALGAEAPQIRRLVLGYAGGILLPGLLLGALGAFWSSQWLAAQLYGVERTDPLAYLAAALLLGITCTLAFWGPLRRALRVDPSECLKG